MTQLDVVDIVRQLGKVMQENGPSQEDDLLEALCASQPEIMISVYGTITAFLDWYPGFQVLYEELYTFVYYKCTDDEDDILDGAAAASCIRRSNKSGLQFSFAGGDEMRRTSVIYFSSPSGGGDKQEKGRIKEGWS
ncbi:hypothetical protein HPB52_013120 [Rhipicephalus sanguineus]|uniref:Uncharacterized protein n=1 Tax=Rhipicephalus sanguineus TaxID=34632 RepID=A0A9D4TA06_RHISA|nr:hypothetical protein HPB52_013120 [Rhipicephalus sanguineus]